MADPAQVLTQHQAQSRPQAFVRYFEHRDFFTWISFHDEGKRQTRVIQAKDSKTARPKLITDNEIFSYPFLMLNQHRISTLVVDVDDVDPIAWNHFPGFDPEYYAGQAVPLPNLVTISSEKRFQALWVLDQPIPVKKASPRTWDYLRAIKGKLNHVLNGDFAFALRGAARNPFQEGRQVVEFHRNRLDLAKLDLVVKIEAKTFDAHRFEYRAGGRNRATFEFALRVFKDQGEKATEAQLLSHVQTFQALAGSEDAPALALPENRGIVQSVLKNGHKYKVRALRRYGVMQLPPTDWANMDAEERLAEIRRRQSLGGQYSASKVEQNKRAAVLNAAQELGEKASFRTVAKAAGVSLRTVQKHWTR